MKTRRRSSQRLGRVQPWELWFVLLAVMALIFWQGAGYYAENAGHGGCSGWSGLVVCVRY